MGQELLFCKDTFPKTQLLREGSSHLSPQLGAWAVTSNTFLRGEGVNQPTILQVLSAGRSHRLLTFLSSPALGHVQGVACRKAHSIMNRWG